MNYPKDTYYMVSYSIGSSQYEARVYFLKLDENDDDEDTCQDRIYHIEMILVTQMKLLGGSPKTIKLQ